MADYKIDIEASAKNLPDKIQERFGVSAERLLELAQADQAGRCLVLPFKVGDVVWTNTSLQGSHFRHHDMPHPVKVVFIGIGAGGYSFSVEYANGRSFPFFDMDLGRHVFLSCDEAMAALKGVGPDVEK